MRIVYMYSVVEDANYRKARRESIVNVGFACAKNWPIEGEGQRERKCVSCKLLLCGCCFCCCSGWRGSYVMMLCDRRMVLTARGFRAIA